MWRSRLLIRAALPRPPTMCLAPSSRLLATTPSAEPPTPSSSTSPPSSSAASAILQTAEPDVSQTTASQPASYFVARTPSQNLPIYEDRKRGGNLKLTLLKKIAGDAQALKRELAQELALGPDGIRVNPITGHIQISGHHKNAVMQYLTKRGF